ncbi:MAG: response regulator [Alphaproteobacteria bacterium]|nr:response regulator [Alphaproteobacteria bacterium]
MTEAITVVVADDEPLAVRRLVSGLAKMPNVKVVGTAGDGRSALDLVRNLSPDIVFLDIKMPALSGLDVAKELSGTALPAIIFVTAFGRFAIKAFDLAAVDYLLKPVDFDRLHEAIERAIARRRATHAEQRAKELQGLLDAVRDESLQNIEQSHGEPAIWLRDKDGHVRVPRTSIEYVQADRDYVHVHTRGSKYLVRETLHAFLEQLQSVDFVQVHRSYVVNVSFVERLSKRISGSTVIQMVSGASIPVGRNYAASIRGLLTVLARRTEQTTRALNP